MYMVANGQMSINVTNIFGCKYIQMNIYYMREFSFISFVYQELSNLTESIHKIIILTRI